MSEILEGYDGSKIIFKKAGKNYKMLYSNEENKFQILKTILEDFTVPFGIENYNRKNILNLEFTNYKKSNNMYNMYAKMKQLDKLLWGLNVNPQLNISNRLKELLENKQYKSFLNMRNYKFDPLIRIHLKGYNGNISSIFTKDGINISPITIKKMKGNFKIEIGPLWITNNNFGLILYLIYCKLK